MQLGFRYGGWIEGSFDPLGRSSNQQIEHGSNDKGIQTAGHADDIEGHAHIRRGWQHQQGMRVQPDIVVSGSPFRHGGAVSGEGGHGGWNLDAAIGIARKLFKRQKGRLVVEGHFESSVSAGGIGQPVIEKVVQIEGRNLEHERPVRICGLYASM